MEDDGDDAPRRGLRALLLKYTMYQSLLAPTPDHVASAFDAARTAAWSDALRRVLNELSGDTTTAVAVFPAARELPGALALALALATDARVVAYEPVRPRAVALRAAAVDNGVEERLSVVACPPHRIIRPGAHDVIVAPALEDVGSFFAGLCELADARRRLAASASPVIVLPRRVQLRATLLHVPCQCAPLRTPLSEPIAGFNLRPFARLLRGAAPADAVLLEHVRYDRLSDACVALELETAAEWAAPSFDGRECEVDDNSSEDSGDGDAATQRTWSFTAHMDVKAAGSANAVAFWTDCELQPDDGWVLQGCPPHSARRQLVHFLPDGLDVAPGEVLTLRLESDAAAGVRVVGCALRRSSGVAASATEGEARAVDSDATASATTLERWHWPMMLDRRRNDAYNAAIAAAVAAAAARKGRAVHVLDIGGGSGLLAMMAARAGAASVCCVERLPAVANAATAVVAANGLAAVVSVVTTESTALAAPVGEPADVIVSEVLDDGLLGEGVIGTLAHARRTLAAPDALVLPARAAVWAQLAHVPAQPAPVMPTAGACDAAPGRVRVDALLPTRTRSYHSARLDRISWRSLSAPLRALEFNFAAPLHLEESVADYARSVLHAVPITEAGRLNAVVFWFTALLFDDGASRASQWDICSWPDAAAACGAAEGTRCWQQALHMLPAAVDVAPGATVDLLACHSPERVYFRVNGVC